MPLTAKREQRKHLSHLILKRIRTGLLTLGSGTGYMKLVQKICESSLSRDRRCWEQESEGYLNLCKQSYSIPATKR